MTDNIFSNAHLFTLKNKYFLFDGDSLRLFELDKENYTTLHTAKATGDIQQ